MYHYIGPWTYNPCLSWHGMDQNHLESNEFDFLLDHETIIDIAPQLEGKLTKETAYEFSKQLYQLTKLVYERYKDEKKEFNT